MAPPGYKNGGRQARIGSRFAEELEQIKIGRIKNGQSKEIVSTEKITNMITRHKYWKEIREEIIESPQEEFDKHGK